MSVPSRERDAGSRSMSVPGQRPGDAVRPTLVRSSIVVVLLTGMALGFGYVHYRNRIVALDVAVDTQWKQVENQLERQHDLLPKLAAVAKRYAEHERSVLDQLFTSRAAYTKATAVRRPEAAAELDGALSSVLALAERYPDLKADRQYRELAYEIAGTKNRIAVERGRYNELVGSLNTRLQQIPWRWVASGIEERAFYQPPEEKTVEPELDL